MKKNLILAIDQGTTGTTVLIFNPKLQLLAKKNNEFKQHYPQPGWVEHDPQDIWNCTLKTMKQALNMAKVKPHDIACIGITNQRETTCVWERHKAATPHRAIVWQDRRTSPLCDDLKKKGYLRTIRSKTGLVLDPYFSATKMNWLLHDGPKLSKKAQSGQLAMGTIDSYLVWKLTKGQAHITDVSNASRTLLMNLKTLQWDASLLDIFDIPSTVLPEIKSSSEIYGTTKGLGFLPDGIPISGIAGDQQAALFGQACFKVGEAKCTYGTGSFLLMNIGQQPILSKGGLLTSVGWKINKNVSYVLEGSSFIAGAAVQWLRDELQMIKKASDIEKLAQTVSDTGGVYFVPALAGLGAPHWNPQARGLITGLTRGTNKGHIARAVLEGIAFQHMDIMDLMIHESKRSCKALKVDGGACANNLLMQTQANVLGIQIIRPHMIETTALGAAFLAGLAVGIWKDQNEIRQTWKQDHLFTPHWSKAQRLAAKTTWAHVVKKA